MFIRLINTAKCGFLKKLINFCMYKICIKSYMSIKHSHIPKQRFKNTLIKYE